MYINSRRGVIVIGNRNGLYSIAKRALKLTICKFTFVIFAFLSFKLILHLFTTI